MRLRLVIPSLLLLSACRNSPFAEGTSVDSLHFAAGASLPVGFLKLDRSVDSIMTIIYSRELAALGEQRLDAAGARTTESYRFTWLRAFDPPVSVRLYATTTDTFAVGSQTSERAVFNTARLVRRDSVRIRTAVWDSLRAAMGDARFWSAREERTSPVFIDGKEHRIERVDGAQWLLEGLRQSRYHIVERWSPADTGSHAAFRRAALLMLRAVHMTPDSATIY